jgi:SAM-dependent methyltransferase
MKKDFSHVQETTLYMEAVKRVIDHLPPGKLLDCPAGKGIIGDFARARGFTVTSADINEERKDFVYCDMDQPLPFADGEFDVSVSLEGVEHLLYPTAFLRELVRITKPGGTIILSTPNTANFYSRLQFLLTGTFFQFAPKDLRNIGDRKIDRCHVSSLTPSQIHYFDPQPDSLFHEHLWGGTDGFRARSRQEESLLATGCPALPLHGHCQP